LFDFSRRERTAEVFLITDIAVMALQVWVVGVVSLGILQAAMAAS
jgi:hypothetical protein